MEWAPTSEAAQRALLIAREEANQRGCREIEPAHLLLGVARQRGTVAANVLDLLGTQIDQLLETARGLLPASGAAPVSINQFLFSKPARAVLEQAHLEAKECGHEGLGSEHILFALILQRDTTTCSALEALGIELTRAEEECRYLLSMETDASGFSYSGEEAAEEGAAMRLEPLWEAMRGRSDEEWRAFLGGLSDFEVSEVYRCAPEVIRKHMQGRVAEEEQRRGPTPVMTRRVRQDLEERLRKQGWMS